VRIDKFLTILLCYIVLLSPVSLQAEESSAVVDESLRDLSIVVGIGVGGAILGLSTLSFVEVPKDHLKNIVTGGAIGIIIGVSIVAYKQATKSQDMYTVPAAEKTSLSPANFDTSSRLAWHQESFNGHSDDVAKPSFLFSFSY